jgi:hypothetical protein
MRTFFQEIYPGLKRRSFEFEEEILIIMTLSNISSRFHEADAAFKT